MSENKFFTSESVSNGHPDKVADQISDAILDASLEQDPHSRVACETLLKNNLVMLAGEITTQATINIEAIVRKQIADIGYTNAELGFDASTCTVLSVISKQSPDIAQSVDNINEDNIGAGDQGLVFGYATNETEALMPMPILYAHRLMMRQKEVRAKSVLPWICPDAKSQVTVEYENSKPVRIQTVLISTQHLPNVKYSTLKEAVIEEIIKPTLPAHLLDEDTEYLINPSGRFVIGGPAGDCGLTGRKIIVDSYGGMARHGGGCFSGKDPTKIDRSAAYMARYIAKNVVVAGIAERCEIQLSYAIGIAKPVSLYVDTFGTGAMPDALIGQLIKDNFDLRPGGIIKTLSLKQPVYRHTASYGHFGRLDYPFCWEDTKHAHSLFSKFVNEAVCCGNEKNVLSGEFLA